MPYQNRLNIEELKKKVDIVRVIGNYLELIKKGSSYVAVCPFHNDTRPSLSISTSKQIFNCFVCHTGGDSFAFVQKYEKISYLEAVKKACDICGVECEIKGREPTAKEIQDRPIYLALEDLAQYYSFYLETQNGKAGLDYLLNRGLDLETIHRFRIGFAPDDSSLSIGVLRNKKNHSIETLTAAGIISENSTAFRDRNFNRIMFPLADSYGRVVGFSGRLIEKDSLAAKYINSPETSVFKKNELLYNFHSAKELAKKCGYLYLVEGFMDVIALSTCGLPAVALMGTALTSNHVAHLKRLNIETRLALDSDNAGQLSTQKCIKILTDSGLRYKIVAPLVSGKDPDELLRSSGPNQVIEAMESLEEPLIHLLNYARINKQLESYEQKEKFIEDNRGLFGNLSPLKRHELLPQIASAMKLSVESLEYVLAPKNNYQSRGPIYRPPSRQHRNLFDDMAEKVESAEGSERNSHQLLVLEARLLNYLRSARAADEYLGDEPLLSETMTTIRLLFGDHYRENPALLALDEGAIATICGRAQLNETDRRKEQTARVIETFLEYSDPLDYERYEEKVFASHIRMHRQLVAKQNLARGHKKDIDEVDPDLDNLIKNIKAMRKN